VVIVDVRMPGGSAFDVIHRMKHSTRLGPIPIIAISSGMNGELAAALNRQGADRCMKKPVDLNALLGTVMELTSQQEFKIVHRSISPKSPAYKDVVVETEAEIGEQLHG
jgi:CheY-like chemotaxis protein